MWLVLVVAGVRQIAQVHCILFRNMVDCFGSSTVYGVESTDMSFPYYRGGIRKNSGIWRNTEIVLVNHGRIRTYYLCFTDTPIFTDSLVLDDGDRERANEGSADSGSYVSYCWKLWLRVVNLFISGRAFLSLS